MKMHYICFSDFDTHGRLTDFFIGMMMGIFMRFKKDQPFFGNMNNKSVSKFWYKINK